MSKDTNQFVSRGGLKMQHAIEQFKLNVKSLVVLDVGSSTGGFVDCLLQNGAAKVYAVDTAYGEFAWKLRNDPRVVVMERTNILHLKTLASKNVIPSESSSRPVHIVSLSDTGGGISQPSKGISPLRSRSGRDDNDEAYDGEKVDLITIDASWTKLEKILPVVSPFLKPDGQIMALLKPHYQAEKSKLIKGVLEEGEALRVKGEVEEKIKDLGFTVQQSTPSPILGGGGNTEYLLLIS